MSKESNKTWAGFWALIGLVLSLIWIFKVNLFSGIGYALGFSFLKRFVIKGTITKFIAFTPENADPEIAASKLTSRLNRNIFVCTLLQLFALLLVISPNTDNATSNYRPNSPKQSPISNSERANPQPDRERIQPSSSAAVASPKTTPLTSHPIFREREWTDRQGRNLTAELIDIRTNQAGVLWGKFRRPNGETFTYEINSLSSYDINLLQEWLKNP